MVGNIIFNILAITGMAFNIGTSKGQEPNININQAPQVETLKANHTYTFDYDSFAIDNENSTPTENDILVIEVSSAINGNNEVANPLTNNYIGFRNNINPIDIQSLLYYNTTQIGVNDDDAITNNINQFTVIDLIIYTNDDLTSIYPYLTDITQGGQIISSIASGLGLIGNLVNEFSNGFKAIFWTGTEITSFGTFALIMLGVSVSFAIIKLILYIIRNKSGT